MTGRYFIILYRNPLYDAIRLFDLNQLDSTNVRVYISLFRSFSSACPPLPLYSLLVLLNSAPPCRALVVAFPMIIRVQFRYASVTRTSSILDYAS